jgi:hypothetical protein
MLNQMRPWTFVNFSLGVAWSIKTICQLWYKVILIEIRGFENSKFKFKKKAPPEGSGAVNFNSLPKGIVAPHQSLGLNFNEGKSLFSFYEGKLFGFRYFQGIFMT